MPATFTKDLQYRKFCTYGFLKNLRFFEPFMLLFLLEKDKLWLNEGVMDSTNGETFILCNTACSSSLVKFLIIPYSNYY